MLKKLIKYEWKSTNKVGFLLLAAIGLTTLLGALIFRAPIWQSMSENTRNGDVGETLLNLVSVLSVFLYIILLVGAVYGIFIYLLVRFYRSMYKSEGYLLHTLPVTKHQILISKILVSTIWVYLVYFAMMCSVIIFFFSMLTAVTGVSVSVILKSVGDFFSDTEFLFSQLGIVTGFSLNVYWVLMLLSLILGVPAGLITMFGAVSLGQLFAKNRVLMAIVCYIGIMIARQLLTAVLQGVNYAGSVLIKNGEFFRYMNSSLAIRLIMNLLLAAGCYVISYYVTTKRLNME